MMDPHQIWEPDYTETDPWSDNFEWLGYETQNFFLNLGSIILFVAFLIVRSLLNPMLTVCRWRDMKCCGNIVNKCWKSKNGLINDWITIYLEFYFELIISSICALLILQMEVLTVPD